MPLVQAKCESCGGLLTVDSSLKMAKCPFCGSDYIVQESINHYNSVTNIEHMHTNVVQVSDESSSEGRLKAADAYLKLGKFEKAFLEYKTVTEMTPQNYRGWLGLVESFTNKYEMPFDNVDDLDLLEDWAKSVLVLAPDEKGISLTAPYREYIKKELLRHADSVEKNLSALGKQTEQYEQLCAKEINLREDIKTGNTKKQGYETELKNKRLVGGGKRADLKLALGIS